MREGGREGEIREGGRDEGGREEEKEGEREGGRDGGRDGGREREIFNSRHGWCHQLAQRAWPCTPRSLHSPLDLSQRGRHSLETRALSLLACAAWADEHSEVHVHVYTQVHENTCV